MKPLHKPIFAICLDSGDTLVDEGSEVRDAAGIVTAARPIPGAVEMVQALRRRGCRLALVADGYTQSFKNILGGWGLYDLFEIHAISDALGVEKPHPRMFQAALDGLGILPAQYGQVMMVGNNLERDIAGANALGMISVFITWSPRRSKTPAAPLEIPRYTIREPLGLLALLDEIEKN
jgi:putative hydrolase of the HAD superfamily